MGHFFPHTVSSIFRLSLTLTHTHTPHQHHVLAPLVKSILVTSETLMLSNRTVLKREKTQTKKKTKAGKKCLHWPGIEPGPPAWQARILPLNHQCFAVELEPERQHDTNLLEISTRSSRRRRQTKCSLPGRLKAKWMLVTKQQEPHARASTASWMTYSMVKKALDESIPW